MRENSTPVYSGILTNYCCNAECRHCMFRSSPCMPKEFLGAQAAVELCQRLADAGVRSAHIGGGEPFLSFGSLLSLLDAMDEHSIAVDYIETNAFWANNQKIVYKRLSELAARGKPAVMVSVDPYHLEFVPLDNAMRLVSALLEGGFQYFIWQERFIKRLRALDGSMTHTVDELKGILGDDYVEKIALEYGVKANGRAIDIARRIYPLRPAAEIAGEARPCRNLLSGAHCHIDLYQNIIPPGCPGISIAFDDFLACSIDESRYPAASRLYTGGVSELLSYAVNAGFAPGEGGYATKCDLCYSIRAYLAKNMPSADISPLYFYD